MAIEDFMTSYKVYEVTHEIDVYGAELDKETYLKDTYAAIHMFDSNMHTDNQKYAEVTHFGLTKDKTLHMGQILVGPKGERYSIILPVNHITRYSQMHLKRLEDYE